MVLAADGLLERDVSLKTDQTVTVPVVPNGLAGANGVSLQMSPLSSLRGRFGGLTLPRTWHG